MFILLKLDFKGIEVEIEGDFTFLILGLYELESLAVLKVLKITVQGHVEIIKVLFFDLVQLLFELCVLLIFDHDIDIFPNCRRYNLLGETHVIIILSGENLLTNPITLYLINLFLPTNYIQPYYPVDICIFIDILFLQIDRSTYS